MIADLKPYAEYKESGLPWLGQVPGHWSLIPNRGLVRKRKVLVGNRHGDYRLLSLTKQGVIVRDISTGKGKFSSDMGTSQEVRTGDLVFCLFDVPETPRTVGLSRHDGMITGAYTIFESLGRGSAEYFELFYRAMDDRKLLSPLYSGLRNTIPPERFLGTKSPLPPPDEQAAIVRFLDWANGRLERAIRAKRKVIALLGEQKQAIIHRAVTRGLDPSVPLKPSGIPWLGDIPQHWVVERTKNVFRLRTQKSGLSHGKELLSIYTHIGVRPRKDLEQKGNKASTTDNYWIVQKGDLIVNKLLAWMGAVGSSDYEGVTSPAYDILMPIRPLCSDYYHHLFRTKLYQQLFKQRSRGIMDMRLRLYFDQLGQIPVPFPPVDEQAAIVAFYVEETADLTVAISRLNREIELLREYRTRLVADVVTGKLDVREVALRLPDEAPPDATEDDADLHTDADASDEKATL